MLSFRRIKTAFTGPFTLSIPLSFKRVRNMFISCKFLWFFIFYLAIYQFKRYNPLFLNGLNFLSSYNNFNTML
jgi:hypothetical protein